MKILVTGSSRGIGKKVSEKYLSMGHSVYGIDMLEKSITHENYTHFTADIKKRLYAYGDGGKSFERFAVTACAVAKAKIFAANIRFGDKFTL